MTAAQIEDHEFLELFESNLLDSEPDKTFSLFVNHTNKQATCEIYRRPMSTGKNSNLFEYFTRGTWKDLHPERLFFSGLDHDYRKSWDENVLEIALLDQVPHGDESSPSETLHWVNKFPFPLANREYVYVRRGVLVGGSTFVILSRHTPHSAKPVKSSPVRVEPMTQRFVMRADGNDTRFALLYADDLGGAIPSWLLNAAASKLIPGMIDQMYAKAQVYPADRLDKMRAQHRSDLAPKPKDESADADAKKKQQSDTSTTAGDTSSSSSSSTTVSAAPAAQ
jgi:hypothetical protein